MIKIFVFVLLIYLGFIKEGLNKEILDFVFYIDLLVVGVFFYIVK